MSTLVYIVKLLFQSWRVRLGTSIATLYVVYYFTKVSRRPRLYYAKNDSNGAATLVSQFVDTSKLLKRKYYPPIWGWHAHIMTYLGALLRPLHVDFQREIVKMKDGGEIALDWTQDGLPNSAPLLFVVPGLTGSSEANYIRQLVTAASSRGIRSVVMTNRGLYGSPLLTARAYCGAHTGDLRAAINFVHQKQPTARIIACGYSLGSNLLVKYLGEEGDATPVEGAISCSNPYNFASSSKTLPLIYSWHLAKGLVQYFLRHKEMLSQHPEIAKDADKVVNAKTLREFDELVTRRGFGYSSVDAYYEDAGCITRMDGVRRPLLCISAIDDPIVNPTALPMEQCQNNPNILLAVTARGGHVSFLEGLWPVDKPSYSDKLSIEFIQFLFKNQPQTTPK